MGGARIPTTPPTTLPTTLSSPPRSPAAAGLAVDVGEPEVEDHDVVRLARERLDGGATGRGRHRSVSVQGEDLDEDRAQSSLVLDDQDVGGARRAAAGRRVLDRLDVLSDRKLDGEARARGRGVLDRHAPLVSLDDADAEAEPEPGAFADRLGGEEGVEDPTEVLGRDAGAVVLDHDRDAVLAVRRAHAQHAVAPVRAERVSRIREQVEEHLLELVP